MSSYGATATKTGTVSQATIWASSRWFSTLSFSRHIDAANIALQLNVIVWDVAKALRRLAARAEAREVQARSKVHIVGWSKIERAAV
jgi:hypothetical protein